MKANKKYRTTSLLKIAFQHSSESFSWQMSSLYVPHLRHASPHLPFPYVISMLSASFPSRLKGE